MGGKVLRRGLSLLACGLAASLFTVRPAFADSGGVVVTHNNVIQLTNSNSTRPDVGTGTALAYDTANAAVTDTNIAYAQGSNCTGCRTVAVAVQVVVVGGTPSNVQPQNAAVAVNNQCQSCFTFAYAHQYVIEMNGPFVWSNSDYQAARQLEAISGQISQVANSGEDAVTMSSQLDQLSLQYYSTVDQALQSQNHGNGGQDTERRQVNDD
jgi:hypothetical protein